MKKQDVYLNKPRFIGQVILALSKLVMYNFHHHIIHSHFHYDKIKVGMSDADSFLYQIEYDGDIYEKMLDIDHQHDCFNFSNFPKTIETIVCKMH